MALINPIVGPDHWLLKVRRSPSSNYYDRKSAIALLVIHGISLPQGRFGTGFAEDLFCNRLDLTAHPSFRSLEGVRVSTHLLISRWGKVTQYDLSINKGPKGTQPLYGVTPNPKEALSGDFKTKFVEFNDRVDVEKVITPATASEVCEIMGWSVSEATAVSDVATDEDFDFDFE